MSEGGKSFLEEKYPDLQQAEEVEKAVKRQETRTGEKVEQQPNAKIEAYLDRLNEVFNPNNPDKRERRVSVLKDKLHELFVVNPEDIPESYFAHQKQIAREQGHGDINITDEMRRQMADTIIHDQAQSLDAWVDYLGSDDAKYPNWLKYFAFRSITKLSEYDKEKKEFKKRSKGTTAPFPDINREALAYVLDSVEKSHKKEAKGGATDEQWEKLLKTANFGKLYAHAIEKITPASQEDKENIQGAWIKYEQGSDAEPLYKSLQGHGTGWCTAGEGVAKNQLQVGDFYVYYTESKKGKTPRVAIRMQQGEIAEVRGIDKDQNLEGSMTNVAKEKMKGLPGAEKYEKRVSDMKRLTEIENKVKMIEEVRKRMIDKQDSFSEDQEYNKRIANEAELEAQKFELTREELRFLYEMDGKIDGFGYREDPRVEEIRDKRDFRKDAAIVFECSSEQLAANAWEITENTKIYVGKLEPRIFELIQKYNIERIYTSLTSEMIIMQSIEIGGKTGEELISQLKEKGVDISNLAMCALKSEELAISKPTENISLLLLSARDLGFEIPAPLKDGIYPMADRLGLELCPAEIGPEILLRHADKPLFGPLGTNIGMKPIRTGKTLINYDEDFIFDVFRGDNGNLQLGVSQYSGPGMYNPDNKFVFCLRKPKEQENN